MTALDFRDVDLEIRPEITEAHARFWSRLAEPGCWWTGAERVAIASAVRLAKDCDLCRVRRSALGPETIEGEHCSREELPAAAVEAIHRIVTDPARLSRGFVEKALAGGLSDGHYVELVGIVVAVVSIDAFCRGLGLSLHPLPTPRVGEPTHARPAGLEHETGWLPMLRADAAEGEQADLWSRGRSSNVFRALSLVPDAVRDLKSLSDAHYLSETAVWRLVGDTERALERPQIELIAGRVSALHECFY